MSFPRVLISSRDGERAAPALYRAGYRGASEEDRPEGTVLAAVFDRAESAALARELLAAEGIESRLEVAEAPEDPFASFRESLRPFRVGSFWIEPREASSDPAEAGLLSLHVPAACAFGTGLHESTRGILRELDRGGLEGLGVLDAGCGSAILAVAAVRKGARRAVGFDIDLEAVFEARRNLRRNGVEAEVRLFAGGAEALAGAFDRVLANMIWEESGPILPALARLLVPGGCLILSGILDEREEAARAGVGSAGLDLEAVFADGEWRTLRARKPTG
ncbi:MAG: 50S ribosomal protein L11 methyltransferase [Verrucomicrobiota bacterium]